MLNLLSLRTAEHCVTALAVLAHYPEGQNSGEDDGNQMDHGCEQVFGKGCLNRCVFGNRVVVGRVRFGCELGDV